jgi:serine/threonine protein kinase
MPAILTERRPAARGPVDDVYATALIDGPLPIHRPSDDLIDQAYSEYRDLRAAGVEVDPDAFCARFPAYETSLRKLVELHRRLEENPDLVTKLSQLPVPGQHFFGFDLEEELGRGAFAHVFLAREPRVGSRRVVVKATLHADGEADTLGKFRHPNVAQIHSARHDEKTGFSIVCMPFLGGRTLLSVIERIAGQKIMPGRADALLAAAKDKRWPADSAAPPAPVFRRGTYLDGVLYLGERLADALAYVHERGVLHRDLKPSNILVCPNGEPVLIDFNLAHDRSLTEYRLGGTLPYMPPEQLESLSRHRRGEPVVGDYRADVYALGVILYELLTGAHPFGPVPMKLKPAGAREFLLSRQKRGPRPLRTRDRKIDPAVEALILGCLSADPDCRPVTARELATELRRLQSPVRRARRWVVNHAKAVAAAAVMLATGGTALGGYIASLPSADATHKQAGLNLYHDGKYQQAIEEFTASLAANPNQPDVRVDRGRAFFNLGNWPSAYDDLKKADPDHNARAAACLGYCMLQNLEDSKETARYFQKAIDAGMNTAAVYNDLSIALIRCRDFGAAERAADKALDLAPGLTAAHYNRGVARWLLWCETHDAGYALAGLDDLREVLNQGIDTANSCFYAAELCAGVLADRAEDPTFDPKMDSLWEVGAGYLRRAIELGFPREQAGSGGRGSTYRSEWESNFSPGMKTQASQKGIDERLRLVEPLMD